VVQPVAEPATAVEPVVEAEPLPDYSDGSWIEQRTAELITLTEPNGNNGETLTREVLSGKFLITYRRRTPADGDAPFEVIPPRSRQRVPDEAAPVPGTLNDFRADVLNHKTMNRGQIDPRVLKKYAKPSSPPTWIAQNSGFTLTPRNRPPLGHEDR
jgi:hypothetical protein